MNMASESLFPFVRLEALQSESYQLVENPQALRLHQNEGMPLDPELHERMTGALAEALKNERPLHVYPNLVPSRLISAYARYLGVPPECVEVTAGSSQGLSLIASACFSRGRRVALPEPTFSIYESLARLSGADVVDMPLNNAMEYARDSIFNPVVFSTDVALFCSPNNPTGTIMPEEWILEFIERYKGLVVVDEAYLEYAAAEGVPSMIRHIGRFKNLLVLRTLSKAWGAAGLRVGAMVGDPELIEIFKRLRPPYSIPFPSEAMGCFFLESCQGQLQRRVDLTLRQRKMWEARLAKIPELTLYRSQANFVFFTHPRAVELVAWLREKHQILVRLFDAPGLENHIRASLWTLEANNRFIEKVEEFFS